MMDQINKLFLDTGFSLLPPQMDTAQARAMLLAIGLQESRFQYRFQVRGPARGFWQFESGGGVAGVINHRSTRYIIADACDSLVIPCTVSNCYQAIAYNDVLACVFARLLLWTLPFPLPEIGNREESWHQYIDAWRPGKPHRHTWDDLYQKVMNFIGG